MAGHALEEKDSVCLVQDGVRGTAGVAKHVPGKEKTNLRNIRQLYGIKKQLKLEVLEFFPDLNLSIS